VVGLRITGWGDSGPSLAWKTEVYEYEAEHRHGGIRACFGPVRRHTSGICSKTVTRGGIVRRHVEQASRRAIGRRAVYVLPPNTTSTGSVNSRFWEEQGREGEQIGEDNPRICRATQEVYSCRPHRPTLPNACECRPARRSGSYCVVTGIFFQVYTSLPW